MTRRELMAQGAGVEVRRGAKQDKVGARKICEKAWVKDTRAA